MTPRFNPPPNWPQPPAGWVYPVGWQPDPNWPAPPDRWPFWVDEGHPTPPQSEAPTIPIDLPLNSGVAPAVTAGGNLAPLASPSPLAAPDTTPSPYAASGTTPGASQPQAGPQAMLISPLPPATSAGTPTQPKPGHKSRRPGSGAKRSGFVKHWKRNVAIAAAAALVITVGVVFVPKWLGPDVAGLQQRGDVAGLNRAVSYWGDATARERAAVALGAIGTPDSLVPLFKAESDSKPTVRSAAAAAVVQVLGRTPDAQAATTLIALGADTNKTVAEPAKAALGPYLTQIGPDRAVAALLAAQGDSRQSVSSEAAAQRKTMIDGLHDEDAVRILIALYANGPSDVGDAAKATLADLLSAINPSRAVRALLIVQADSRTAVSTEARTQITKILGGLDDKAAVSLLKGLTVVTFESTEPVRSAARVLFTAYLVGIGPDRAAKAVLSQQAGDEWLAVALGVTLDQLSLETKKRGIQIDSMSSINDAAGPVPNGTALTAAHAYAASVGFHPLVILGPGKFAWAAGEPTALRFLELVASVKDGDGQQVEVCRYTGTAGTATVTRYQSTRVVTVYSALTAQVVATQTFTGGTPAACERNITTYSGAALSINGDPPADATLTTWLNSLVHAP
jgi:HEAT repeat protein